MFNSKNNNNMIILNIAFVVLSRTQYHSSQYYHQQIFKGIFMGVFYQDNTSKRKHNYLSQSIDVKDQN